VVSEAESMTRRSSVLLRYPFSVIGQEENRDGQSQKFGGRTITGDSSSSGIGRKTRRTRRCEITGASSGFGTGGVTIVSPDGNRRTHLPPEVVPTNLAGVSPMRSGGSGRAEDLAAIRLRTDLVLETVESARFLLTRCPEESGD
jgi:hypothetical protein